MKTKNNPTITEIETQLASWRPRRPSAAVERRVFAVERQPARLPWPTVWGWFSPVLTASVVFLVISENWNRASIDETLGGASAEAKFPTETGRLTLRHNVFAAFPAGSFGWTNPVPSPSTNGPFSGQAYDRL